MANTTFAATQNEPFSRESIFGMFLTLQFILLTQPFGSLLFRGTSGFWWRVNPIASLVEGIIIFWQLWLASSRKQVKRHKWQITAAGLLLLRGVVQDEDGTQFMVELLRRTSSDPAEGEGLLATRSESVVEGQVPGRTGDNGPVQLSSEDPALNASVPGSYSTIRRRTSQLEANSPPSESHAPPQSRESRIFGLVFGENTLAHGEWRIGFVTWLSVAAIAVKLLAIRGAFWFRVACFLLLMGWAAVQTLIILFHRREMGDEDKKAAVRLAEVLDKELDDQFWIGVYLLLHSPFFGYVGYRFAFEPLLPPGTFGFVGGAFFCFLYMLPGLLFFLGLPILFVSAIFMLLKCLDSLSRGKLLESGLCLLYCVGLVSLATLSFSVVLGIFASNLSDPLPPGVRVSPKYMSSLIYNSTDGLESRIFEGVALAGYVIYNGVWMLFYFLFVFMPFVAIFLHLRRSAPLLNFGVDGWRVSLGNLCFTLVVFTLYFVNYDKEGTKKPGWTDYLG